MIRIGVVGTGRIVSRFVNECKETPYVELVALYNPRRSSAVYFAEQNGIDGKKVLLTDDKKILIDAVDAVYIAAPHEDHYAYAKEFLQAGKHVLCEKPFTLSGDQAAELYALAQSKRLICMEAIKTAYCPGFEGVLNLLEKGAIGHVYDVEACFTKINASAGRELWGQTGGSFVELGSYPMLPIVKILGTDSIENYTWSLQSAVGTDSYTKMVVSYPNASGTIKTGLGVKSEGELIISGEKGYIVVQAPWWLTKHVEVRHENPNQVEVYDFPFEGAGLRYETMSFAKKILALQKMQKRYVKDENRELLMDSIWNHIMNIEGVTPEESIWLACQMEMFLENRKNGQKAEKAQVECKQEDFNTEELRIWAHRGCSMEYPENTLLSFQKAAEVDGVTGIELDVQLTLDGELVVIHDEKVDRTTTGSGLVKNYTLNALKKLSITPSGQAEAYLCEETGQVLTIPTLREVFELLVPYCKENSLMINIELKNSVVRYEGMEQKVLNLVAEYGLEENIVYSSFLHESVGYIKEMNPEAQTGTLAGDVFSCLEGMKKYHADAIHPSNIGLGINAETVADLKKNQIAVRMWNGEEPLFGQSRTLKKCDLKKYVQLGVTDIITNVPDWYLLRKSN